MVTSACSPASLALPASVGNASALSHTPAEAGQSFVSPQDEKPGDRCPLVRLLACASPRPAVFTPASFLQSLEWAQWPSGSGRECPGVRAFGSSPQPRTRGSSCANTSTPCSSERGLSGTGCSWTLGCPLGGGVLLAHTGDRLLSALLVSLTLDQSSLRSPLRSLSCIQSFASVLASGGTLPKTVYLGFSF